MVDQDEGEIKSERKRNTFACREFSECLRVLVQDNDDRQTSHTFATFIIIDIIANLISLNVEILSNCASATPNVQQRNNEYMLTKGYTYLWLRFGAKIVREKKKYRTFAFWIRW